MKHFFPTAAGRGEGELLERAGREAARCGLATLTPQFLREATAHEGCDFATALLHRSIVESEVHAPFLRRLGSEPPRVPRRSVRVVVVPGAFYRENPHTGADGRVVCEVAQELGLPITLAPVSSTGFLTQNAQLLSDWLARQPNEPHILVSVSKGGSDVKAALARPDAAQVFARVIGWVNLCGILDGSPMADWLLSPHLLARANRFVYRIRGHSLDFLSDMRRYPGCALDFPFVLPVHLRAAHVVGFPLRRHLRNGLVRRCHARLERDGPNDGSILLADAPGWPGQLCPIWGADHYLRPREDLRPLLAALLVHFAA